MSPPLRASRGPQVQVVALHANPSDTADVCGFKYSTHETDYGNFSNQFIGTLGQFSLILHMMEQSGIYVSFCF